MGGKERPNVQLQRKVHFIFYFDLHLCLTENQNTDECFLDFEQFSNPL